LGFFPQPFPVQNHERAANGKRRFLGVFKDFEGCEAEPGDRSHEPRCPNPNWWFCDTDGVWRSMIPSQFAVNVQKWWVFDRLPYPGRSLWIIALGKRWVMTNLFIFGTHMGELDLMRWDSW
jgi:hypothetical protein